MEEIKDKLGTSFRTKDFDPLNYFLRIEVNYSEADSTIAISQCKDSFDILTEFGMENCKLISISTPLEFGLKLTKENNIFR